LPPKKESDGAARWAGSAPDHDMKSKGKLNAADAAKPEEIAHEIAKCDAALQ